MVSAIVTVTFIALMFLRCSVTFSMGLAAVLGLILLHSHLVLIPQYLASGTEGFSLLAVPLFLLAGNLMNSLGLTKRIFRLAQDIVGHIKGGLAQVNVVASIIFAGISGAALADAAGLGVVEVQAMTKAGYRKPFASAITLASASIGPIVPPSIVLVIYGIQAEVSIGKLLVAGIIPGLVIGVSLMVTNYYLAARGIEICPVTPRQSFKKVTQSFGGNILAVMGPFVIVGGIVTGVVTPTESAIVAVLFSLLVGVVYKEISFREIRSALIATVKSTSIIMVMIGISSVISWIYTYERLPQLAAASILSISQNKYVVLALVNVFLLFMGCLIEPIPLLLIATPILVPLMQLVGVDLIHFGVIICYNITLGMMTPPMGVGLYVMMKVVDISFEELVRAVWPFMIPLIATLLLLTFFPPLSLALVNLFWG